MNAHSWAFRALEFYGTRLHHRGQWRVHQWLRTLMRADVDCDLEVTRRNLHWILNPSDFVQSEFFWTGSKDTWDTYHVLKLLKPGDVIFDIGANFGYYSIVACAELGAHAGFLRSNPTRRPMPVWLKTSI